MSQVAMLRSFTAGEWRIGSGEGTPLRDADVTNGRGESVAKYDVLTLVAKERKP